MTNNLESDVECIPYKEVVKERGWNIIMLLKRR